MWRNIFCRFGIPKMIISDNGQQFDNQGFKDFYSSVGIKNQFSSPGHPQANEQTEVTNRTLLKIIKAKLDNTKGAWPKELPNVLSFKLIYGTEAVIPIKVGVTSIRQEAFNEEDNGNHLQINLDCFDEIRDKVSNRMTKY